MLIKFTISCVKNVRGKKNFDYVFEFNMKSCVRTNSEFFICKKLC